MSISDLATRIVVLTGTPSVVEHIDYRTVYGDAFEDTVRRAPDVSRAAQLLGFTAQVGIDEGLRRTIEWWQSSSAELGAR
jgi:UDP-glucose 4-epimerase